MLQSARIESDKDEELGGLIILRGTYEASVC
jgi:hypothetical protein